MGNSPANRSKLRPTSEINKGKLSVSQGEKNSGILRAPAKESDCECSTLASEDSMDLLVHKKIAQASNDGINYEESSLASEEKSTCMSMSVDTLNSGVGFFKSAELGLADYHNDYETNTTQEFESPKLVEEKMIMQEVDELAHDQIRAKYAEILERLMPMAKNFSFQYSKLIFVGPPSVGKSATCNCLLGISENNQGAKNDSEASNSSTLSANQLIALVNKDKWLSSRDFEEVQLLFGYLLMLNDDFELTAHGNLAVNDQSTTASLEAKNTAQPSDKLEAIADRLLKLIEYGDFSKFKDSSMLNSTFLNIFEVRGHPAFLEMLPALIRGPSMYLVCFNMSEDLENPGTIHFSGDSESGTHTSESYLPVHSVTSTISQILSSVAHDRCIPKELTQQLSSTPNLSEIIEKFKKIHPAVALIGTHKDVVIDGYDEKVKAINRVLTQVLQLFDESIDIASQESTSFFPVDNKNSENVSSIRHFISELFIEQFKNAPLPIQPNWLLFEIILRSEYRIATMSDCLKLGNLLEMNEEEIKLSLWYFHYCAGTLMYYPDLSDEWFKDHIICSPQVIFDSISQLIIPSLQMFHSTDPHLLKHKKEWMEKGQFSIQSIERYCRNQDDNDIIPITKLIELLKYASIVFPIHNKDGLTTYFMPAMLPRASPDMLANPSSPDANNPEPLFITFSCGYVPTGMFYRLIAHLVSIGSAKILGLEWKLKQKVVKQNCASFLIHNVNVVTLLSHERCFEIRVARKQDRIALHDLCTHVVSVILYVLESLCESITPIIAFQCPCLKHVSLESRHYQHLCTLEQGVWLQYLCEDSEVVLRKEQKIWIGKHVTPGSDASLEVLKYAKSGYSFLWTKDGSGDPIRTSNKPNLLTFRRVREDDFAHYQCQVLKEGRVVFTTYRALYKSSRTDGDSILKCEPKKTMDSEIEPEHMIFIAGFFDDVDYYLDRLGLNESEKTDVKKIDKTQLGMNKALSLWQKHDPSKATYRELVIIVRSLKKEDIARNIEKYFYEDVELPL